MKEINCQLLVIGSGPGGYVCAIRAGQLGVDTIIADAAPAGGTCLNVGCIPSKALIHAAQEFHNLLAIAQGESPLGITAAPPSIDLSGTVDWKDSIVKRLNQGVGSLLKKSGVTVLPGEARFVDGKTVVVRAGGQEQKVHADNVVIATGSEPVALSALPFGGRVVSSTGALALREVPGRLVVVGAGYIGLELGTAYAMLGSRVTVVEASQQILPQYDAALVQPVMNRLKTLGITVMLDTTALGMNDSGTGLRVQVSDGAPQEVLADCVLVAVGRRPNTESWGREELVLDMNGPFVQVDGQCKTNMRGIYAIGDVTGEPMLAHRAMAQGEMVAELVAGQKRNWGSRVIPAVCFTDPEIVSVGLSEKQAAEQSIQTVSGQFSFRANGRAMTTARNDGFVRVVARADNQLVLGIHAVGVGISELSSAFSLALEMGARLDDIADTIAAHPTRSEGLAEAAMHALGRALHQ